MSKDQVARFRKLFEASHNYALLLDALYWTDCPDWIRAGLTEALIEMLRPRIKMSRQPREYWRTRYLRDLKHAVRAGFVEGGIHAGVEWKNTYELASEYFRPTRARGRWQTMRDSYQFVKKQLAGKEAGRFCSYRLDLIIQRAFDPPAEHRHKIYMRMPSNEPPPASGAPASDVAAWMARMRKLEKKAGRTRI